MFKAMKKHASHNKAADEKAALDLEEGGLSAGSSSSNLGGSKNEEGVELIDHHHHGREMKVGGVEKGGRKGGKEGMSLCLGSGWWRKARRYGTDVGVAYACW